MYKEKKNKQERLQEQKYVLAEAISALYTGMTFSAGQNLNMTVLMESMDSNVWKRPPAW